MQKLKENYQLVSIKGVQCSIGLGAYGSVQLAKCLQTNQTVAVKKIWNPLGITEVKFHQSLNHPNIIKLIDYFYDEQTSIMYIVLQYAENGCLYDFIKENGIQDKDLIHNIFLSTCLALDYMHQNGVMHRDIKPQNILLGKNNLIKLCDFGFAAHCQPRKTVCGTPEYMAPQMIIGKQYNHKVDIWGLGILLFELIQGHAPFQGTSKEIIIKQMKKPIYFSSKFTSDQIQLIHGILRVNSKERPQIKQILSHRFFNHKANKKLQIDQLQLVENEIIENTKNIKILQVRDILFESNRQQKNNNSSSSFKQNKYLRSIDQNSKITNDLSFIKIKDVKSYDKNIITSFRNGKISLKKKPSHHNLALSFN